MAIIPSFESILLELHQSLQLPAPKKKVELIRLERPLTTHLEIISQLLKDVFKVLSMDEQAQADASVKLEEFERFNRTIEQTTWTYNADIRQIVWYLGGYSYAPWLGRSLAFWTMHERLDKGMPSGKFWYLPEISECDGKVKLVMPVTQVMDWLTDLLGNSMTDLTKGVAGELIGDFSKNARVPPDSITRTLYNWRNGALLRSDVINRYFSDTNSEDFNKLDFSGALQLDEKKNPEEQFKSVVEFIERRKLTPSMLCNQIPMDQTRIESILQGNTSPEERQNFIRLLIERYSKPSPRIIRLRLLVASAAQDAYIRLVKLLSGADFDNSSPDINQNKVLQLIEIFKLSHNLTIQANNQCDGEAAEDAFFESQIAPWDREDIFLAVLPSRKITACMELAYKLSRIFANLQPNDTLEDHIGYDEASTKIIANRKVELMNLKAQEDQLNNATLKALDNQYLPWRRTLQELTSYHVICSIAVNQSMSLEVRKMAVNRMHEVAKNSNEVLGTISIQLDQLLNHPDRKKRPREAKAHVAKLIERAKSRSDYKVWQALFLHYEARHHLSCNEFEKARDLFEESIEACKTTGFGKLRGEVSRDAFSLRVERQFKGYSLGNHEKYFRNILAYGGLPPNQTLSNELPLFEDVARMVSNYFWSDLYYPYHGIKAAQPFIMEQAQFNADTLHLIKSADWDGLTTWLKQYPALQNKRLKSVQEDTALMSWMKMLYEIETKLPNIQTKLSPNMQNELNDFTDHLNNWRKAICLMIETWPKLAGMVDFKKQTPLMLAAIKGDFEIVNALLKADANMLQQDINGRSALHGAVTAGSMECIQILIFKNPEVIKLKGASGHTVLHDAIQIGSPEIVKMLIQHDSNLISFRNKANQTPLELITGILSLISDPHGMQFYQNKVLEGRKTGSLAEYQDILSILSKVS